MFGEQLGKDQVVLSLQLGISPLTLQVSLSWKSKTVGMVVISRCC